MKKNIGTIDKILRLVLAITFTALYFTDVITGTIGIIAMALSVIFVGTSLAGVCLIYLPFGLSTCKVGDGN